MATAIIQARMGSTRLPGKTLKLISGRPLLAWVLESVWSLPFVQTVIVATTFLNEDDPIADYCKDHLIACFRGDPFNVMSRFSAIATTLPSDEQIIRVTADNPFYWTEKCCNLYYIHLGSSNDYTAVSGLSHIVCEAMRASALVRLAFEKDLTEYDKEHVTPYFRDHPEKYKVQELTPSLLGLDLRTNQRLTIDTFEDYERIKRLVDVFDMNAEKDFSRLLSFFETDVSE